LIPSGPGYTTRVFVNISIFWGMVLLSSVPVSGKFAHSALALLIKLSRREESVHPWTSCGTCGIESAQPWAWTCGRESTHPWTSCGQTELTTLQTKSPCRCSEYKWE
jgi:hypothetical protein